jgi:hypothetical protein
VNHPEGPAAKPAVVPREGDGDYGLQKQFPEHRPVVALFVHSRYGNGQLYVIELFDAHIHRILESAGEQEERRSIFCIG